ncbi:MAG: phage tail protein [Acidobacteria bacterium]|nr:phage tail protein [Acidobacteriota bacterium]
MEQRFVLELEGRLAGRMFSAEGGLRKRAVVEDDGLGSHSRLDHSGSLDIEPMILRVGTGMSKDFYTWIGGAVNSKTYMRRNGVLIQLDTHSKPLRMQEFADALVTYVEFPDLDRSSSKEAMLKVVVQPERVRLSGKAVSNLGVYASSLPKAWSVNHFRMSIDGLHTDCAQISAIKGIRVKQGFKSHYTGSDRFPALVPTKLEFPNVIIELPLGYGKEFLKWSEDSLNPRKTQSILKNGTIEFLGAGSGSPYFLLTLNNMGMVSMSKGASSYRIELYYESLSMTPGASAVK